MVEVGDLIVMEADKMVRWGLLFFFSGSGQRCIMGRVSRAHRLFQEQIDDVEPPAWRRTCLIRWEEPLS